MRLPTLAVVASVACGIHGAEYRYLSYDQIRDTLYELQSNAPHLVQVFTAQDKYGVATYGLTRTSCFEMLRALVDVNPRKVITNNATLALEEGERPEVFFSGAVHGNERVGPTSTVEFAKLLVHNYLHGSNPWLRRMVDTRIVYIMPAANAHGYAHNVRTEGSVDPNRDFPYGNRENECMVSTAARAINEMYRDHLFQLALTFHSGMKAIAYEWGSPNHPKYHDHSPDHGGFSAVGNILHRYASNGYYPDAAPMNSIVYAVTGGMEDWAYAASWDANYAPTCRPQSFGGYPAAKTVYTSDQLRVFNILVETSSVKTPTSQLGSSDEVLRGEGSPHDGHVARNLRICLAMTDLVRPYVLWQPIPEVPPSTPISGVAVGDAVDLTWDIGGANEVKSTGLIRIPWSRDSCPGNLDIATDSLAQRFINMLVQHSSHVPNVTGAVNGEIFGTTVWSDPSQWIHDDPDVTTGMWSPYRPRYSASYNFQPEDGGRVVLLAAYASVDDDWADPGAQSNPQGVPPQAHVVKARTEDEYRAENAGHVIVGHRVWYSTPRCYQVADIEPTPQVEIDSTKTATQPHTESDYVSSNPSATDVSTTPSDTPTVANGLVTSPSSPSPSPVVTSTVSGTEVVTTTQVAIGENCGPAGYCGVHAHCRGACASGPCASVRCVCADGFHGDGHTCTKKPNATTSGGTWDCVLSECLVESGVCVENEECNTNLLGSSKSGIDITIPVEMSDAALRSAVPMLECSDQTCGTHLVAAVPERVMAITDLTADESATPSTTGTVPATIYVALVGVALMAALLVFIVYRRQSSGYTLVLTEKFNPMWSVDDEVEDDTDTEDQFETPKADNLEEYFEWSMQADDAAGMAAAIGGPPVQ